jgi:hypothetical protein
MSERRRPRTRSSAADPAEAVLPSVPASAPSRPARKRGGKKGQKGSSEPVGEVSDLRELQELEAQLSSLMVTQLTASPAGNSSSLLRAALGGPPVLERSLSSPTQSTSTPAFAGAAFERSPDPRSLPRPRRLQSETCRPLDPL